MNTCLVCRRRSINDLCEVHKDLSPDPVAAWLDAAKQKLVEAIIESARRGDFEAVRQDAVIGKAVFTARRPEPVEDEDPTAGFLIPQDR